MILKLALVFLLAAPSLASAGCLHQILLSLRIVGPNIEDKAIAEYRQYLEQWNENFSELIPDSPPVLLEESPKSNTRAHRIYTAKVSDEEVVFKNYARNSKKIFHEMAMLKVCQNLGIKVINVKGYTRIGNSLAYATSFVDGSVLAMPDGRVRFMSTYLTRNEGVIASDTLQKMEITAAKLKEAGIQAVDLQFLVTPEGEPYLMDVGEFFFTALVRDRYIRRNIPPEGWVDLYMRRFRNTLSAQE